MIPFILVHLSFLFLDVCNTRHYLNRWRPQYAAERLVSVTDLQDYVKARLSLETDCVGSLISDDVVFVLSTENTFTIHLKCILAQDRTKKIDACRDLRSWVSDNCPMIELNSSYLPESDRTAWEVSKYDP
jgi:hypothetical protein